MGGMGGVVGLGGRGVDGRACDRVGGVCPANGGGDGVYRDVAAGDSGVCHDDDDRDEDGECGGS